MSAGVLYAIGTLSGWIGAVALIWSLVLIVQYVASSVSAERPGLVRVIAGTLAVAGLGFMLSAFLIDNVQGESSQGWRLPLVWLVMPLYGWASTGCLAMAAIRVIQAFLALLPRDRAERAMAGLAWLLGGAIFLSLYFKTGGEARFIRGSIPLAPSTAFALASLAVAAVLLTGWARKQASARALATRSVTYLILLAGAVVFGLPFAFLVVTSFKEDRDMVSKEGGIVWVPRVQREVPYLDPENPTYQGSFQGQTVEGEILERLPEGRVKIDINRPMSIRGMTYITSMDRLKVVPKMIPLVTASYRGVKVTGKVIRQKEDGTNTVWIISPAELNGRTFEAAPADVEPIREVGLRARNYADALDYLPPEANRGLAYLKNTLLVVILSVIGTILSSAIVAYAFSRLKFPGRGPLFLLMLSTMMLPAAVTLLPQFLIFRTLGWIDTLFPLWVPAFFASAFNVFLLRQFFMTIPMELEDAAKIDGSSYLNTFWRVMLPQIKPALAVIAIWTFMGAWNNFMGPLIYINSPENMTVAYAVQLYNSDRSTEPGLLMAFVTMSILPVLAVFFFAQRYFIEGVTLSGMGGR